jgi:hypothetical protein
MANVFYFCLVLLLDFSRLSNLSLTTTAEEIKARIISLDTLATVTRDIEAYFVNLDPAESFTSFGRYGITISEYCPINIKLPFRVDISSNDHYFWSDTFSIMVEPPTGIADDSQTIPKNFALFQNYPNPFNPSTTFEFSLPHSAFATLKIYNILGEEITTIVSKKLAAGRHEYKWDASDMVSGLYLSRITTDNFEQTKKLILLK